MNSEILLNKENNMNFRKLSCVVVVIQLLVSVLSLTPAHAAGPALAADDAR